MSQESERKKIATPSPDQVRGLVHPDRKLSVFERALNTRVKKVGAALGILTLATTLGLGGAKLAEGSRSNNSPAPSEPTAEAPETPGPTPTETSPEQDASSQEVIQERYTEQLQIPSGLSTQELGQKIIDDINLFRNVGPLDSNLGDEFDAFVHETGTIDTNKFVEEYIPSYWKTFNETVLADNVVFRDTNGNDVGNVWPLEEDLSAFVLEGYIATFRDEGIPEPFAIEDSLVSATELESAQPNTRVIIIEFNRSNNANQTHGAVIITTPLFSEYSHYSKITLESQNGVDEIIAYDGYNPQ